VDLQRAWYEHHRKGALATVVTKQVAEHEVSNYGVVVARPDGSVVSFQEKPRASEALSRDASTGIYLVEPGVLDLIPSGRVMDIGSELFPALVHKGLPFFRHTQDFHWLDIGRVSDYWRIMQSLMKGEMPKVRMPGKEVRPGVFVGLNVDVHWDSLEISGPVYIGSGARVGPGVKIEGPTWIGNGCRIDEGATLARSILFDYTHIGANALAHERIVSGSYCVNRDGVADQEPLAGWRGDARCGSLLPAGWAA
jgi:mannose-1-phosphate guanylyltransferase